MPGGWQSRPLRRSHTHAALRVLSLGKLQHQAERAHPVPIPCPCQGSSVEEGGRDPPAHLSSRCGSPCPRRRHASAAPWRTRGGPAWWQGAVGCVLWGPAARCRPAGRERAQGAPGQPDLPPPVPSRRREAPGQSKTLTFDGILESITIPELPQEMHPKRLSLLPTGAPRPTGRVGERGGGTQHGSAPSGWAAPTARARSRGTAWQRGAQMPPARRMDLSTA